MKFALASDLHLCFGSLVIENTENAEVLILAGDVYEAADLATNSEYHYVNTFFEDIASKFKHVLWIAGNHEHYGTRYPSAHSTIKSWLAKNPKLSNIQFLERESVNIGGVNIHGMTMWTDFCRADPMVMLNVSNSMNDYQMIENWNTYRQYRTFEDSVYWLKQAIVHGDKNLVVTHHHPCELSIPERYKGLEMNFGYYSDLSNLILDTPDINVWCAGHIHDKIKYTLGETRVLCNPRGYYGHESRALGFSLEFFDI